MTLRSRIAALLVSAGLLWAPAFAHAHEPPAAGYFGTPVSVRGRFVFVTKISRRALRASVMERQKQTDRTVILERADI